MKVDLPPRPAWVRSLWLAAGILSLLAGVVGIVVPLLPTTPLVLLAAWCFSRGCDRCERWLLAHPRLGPMVRQWRATRAVPRVAKRLAYVTMLVGSLWAWWVLSAPWRWVPVGCCALVAVWLWRLPTLVSQGDAPPR